MRFILFYSAFNVLTSINFNKMHSSVSPFKHHLHPTPKNIRSEPPSRKQQFRLEVTRHLISGNKMWVLASLTGNMKSQISNSLHLR